MPEQTAKTDQPTLVVVPEPAELDTDETAQAEADEATYAFAKLRRIHLQMGQLDNELVQAVREAREAAEAAGRASGSAG